VRRRDALKGPQLADHSTAVLAHIELQQGRAVSLLQALIARQAQGEAAVQDFVAERLGGCGGYVERLVYEPRSVPLVDEFATSPTAARGERRSIVARYPGAGRGRSLLVFAHPDGEPLPDVANWQRHPFAGTVEAGRIYGWGVADDLAGVAAAVFAMEAIAAANIVLDGEVIVASTPSKRHARGISAVLHHGYSADAALYLHPAESGLGMKQIKAFASGQLEFSIELEGRPPATTEPAHAAFAHQGVNALDKAMVLLAALRALDDERARRVHHPLLEAAVGRSSNIMVSALQFGDLQEFARLPASLRFSGTVTVPPPERLEAVQADVEAAIAAVSHADPWLRTHPPRLTWISGVSGMEVPATDPLYRMVRGAVEQICGFTPDVNPMHTSSDIRNPAVQKGIPALGLGPLCGDLTVGGGYDEWVDVADYIRSIKVAALAILGWCGNRC
jgi:acetylornithine deacetylase